MSRYTGPRLKKMRALGVNLPGLSAKTIDRRPYPPGQHGDVGRRKVTEYGRRLKEKQKLRWNYGVTERQLRTLVSEARRGKKAAGVRLLELLESRLDNVVFRAGYASTIPAARQLINHGHILINGSRVDIPAYRTKAGEIITMREKSKDLAVVKTSLGHPSLIRPDWLAFTDSDNSAELKALPDSESVPFELDIQLVIEYYAKSL